MVTRERVRTITTTEAAVLALLAIAGERSGYDLQRQVSRSIGHVWLPAKSQLYGVLARLDRDGLVASRRVEQRSRPDKRLHAIAPAGRAALDTWLETLQPGDTDAFYLRLFVGGLTTPGVLRGHVEQFLTDQHARLAELEGLAPTNTRTGHDRYHWFLLDHGLRSTREAICWAQEVLDEL